ncbi:MAG: hypothetical protein MJ211_07370 [Bacteroidales bacterium]|nr:hypothetical protein [Bacteroidales bacterium]
MKIKYLIYTILTSTIIACGTQNRQNQQDTVNNTDTVFQEEEVFEDYSDGYEEDFSEQINIGDIIINKCDEIFGEGYAPFCCYVTDIDNDGNNEYIGYISKLSENNTLTDETEYIVLNNINGKFNELYSTDPESDSDFEFGNGIIVSHLISDEGVTNNFYYVLKNSEISNIIIQSIQESKNFENYKQGLDDNMKDCNKADVEKYINIETKSINDISDEELEYPWG